MRLRIFSDIHLEYSPSWRFSHGNEDAILCAGDLSSAAHWEKARRLIKSSKVPFYFTPGNHEFYSGEFHVVMNRFRALEREFPLFRCLVNESVMLGEYLLVGTPLWTDFALDGKPFVSMSNALVGINDFRRCMIVPRRLQGATPESTPANRMRPITPGDMRAWNRFSRGFIKRELAKGLPTIVLSHWCPTEAVIAPRYRGHPNNPFFVTNCNDLMGANLRFWVHGHTHASSDCIVNGTRVLSNPKGYPRERRRYFGKWSPSLVIEV